MSGAQAKLRARFAGLFWLACIAAGVPVDLREALTGLDEANSGLVAVAVLHASGHRALLDGRGGL